MKKTLFTLFAVFAMVLIGCSQPTGGDIPDWENPPSEIGGGDSTDPEDPVTKFTVTFSTEKGTAPEALTVEKDTILTAEQLKALTFDGFIFKGWFDGETQAIADEYKVTKDVTLTAKWEKSSSTDPDPVDPEPEDPVADPDPAEPEDPATEPEDPVVDPDPVDPEPEKSPYEELLRAIENATYCVETGSISEKAATYFGAYADILKVPDDIKELIIAKFIEKLPEDGNIIGYGYIQKARTVYCYTDKYFVGIEAAAGTKLTSEDLSKDFMIYKKSN